MENVLDTDATEERQTDQNPSTLSEPCDNCEHIKTQLKTVQGMIEDQNNEIQKTLLGQIIRIDQLIKDYGAKNTDFADWKKDHTKYWAELQYMMEPKPDPEIVQYFPLQSEDTMLYVNRCTKKRFKETIQALIRSNPRCKLESIFDLKLILEFNVDGKYGKKRLKDYEMFFSALLEAFGDLTYYNPDSEIKRLFKEVVSKHTPVESSKRKSK